MKVKRRVLYDALKELVRVIDPRASMPILSQVLLRAVAGTLTLTATDLKRTLSCRLPVMGDIDVCIPGKLLATLIKPDGKEGGDVVIGLADTQCAVTFEGLTSRIATMTSADFPAPADGEWSLVAMWPTAPFADALSWVLPAVSTDESRPHIHAVCVDVEHIVATDGHRLHMAPSPARLGDPLLLPLDAAQTLARILTDGEQVVIARAGEHVRFGVGPWQLTTRLVDAHFPPYEKVVPTKAAQSTLLTLGGDIFTKALGRVSRIARNNAVRLRINGAVTMTAADPELGDAEVVVPVVASTHTGDDLVLGVNPTYLRDAIAGAEAFEMSCAGPTDAVRFDVDGRVAVVMPTRL